jgi:hypothetical protein
VGFHRRVRGYPFTHVYACYTCITSVFDWYVMSEGFFVIELGRYGFMLDTEWCYVAISWQLIITSALVFAGYKFYKRKKITK